MFDIQTSVSDHPSCLIFEEKSTRKLSSNWVRDDCRISPIVDPNILRCQNDPVVMLVCLLSCVSAHKTVVKTVAPGTLEHRSVNLLHIFD